MTRWAPVLAGLLIAATLTTTTSVAEAQQMRCQIYSIRASSSGSTIASALNVFRSQLLRPPLSTFTSFELVHTQTVTLSPGGSSPLRLESGINGQIRFDSINGEQRIFNLTLRQNRQNLVNSRVAITAGRPFFVVVPPVNPEGTLVLGVVCR